MSGKEESLINKGYDKEIVFKLCNFSNEELENAVYNAINILTNNVNSVIKPKCIYIGGQPGVGKSVLSNKLKSISNSVELSMDACRSFHPHYKEIEDTIKEFCSKNDNNNPGHDVAAFTQYFAGTMANTLIDRISDMHYNIILEWNMRNSKDVLNCMNKLSKKGYSNEALVLTAHKDLSYEASQIRADLMDNTGHIGRRVDTTFHEICLDTIPNNVNVIYEVGIENNILDSMKVVLRNGKTIWDSEKDQGLPSNIINKYYNEKELSSEFSNNPEWARIAIDKEMIGLSTKRLDSKSLVA